MFLFSFLNSFSQRDSLNPPTFTIGVSPLLFIRPYEDGVYFEYQRNDNVSFEIGGGVYNLFPLPYSERAKYGFTVRPAIKLHLNPQRKFSMRESYFEIVCLYRYMEFQNREYRKNADKIKETTAAYGNGGEEENSLDKIGNEIKHVIGLEALLGKKYFLDEQEHLSIESYFGLGVRLKYRELTITQAHTTSPYYVAPINPPIKETIVSILPSFHMGFKLGISF